MANLPTPGASSGTWGTDLNTFLGVEHNADGTLKAGGSLATKADAADVTALTPGPGQVVVGGPNGPVASPFFNALAYGMDNTGVADCSEAVATMLTDWYAANGGVLYFPRGTYRIDTLPTIPNDGGQVPRQPALVIVGDGGYFTGQAQSPGGASFDPLGGTILDLRGATGPAKIDTRGLGFLELARVTVYDGSGGNLPFLQTTNTTIHVHDCSFYGTKLREACDQDAIILGGTNNVSNPDGDNTDNGPFQGYGSIIERNYFNKIRRACRWQRYANGVQFVNNTIWATCGSNLGASAAAVELTPPADATGVFGNVIAHNLIECVGYVYPVLVDIAQGNTLAHNNFFDAGAGTLAYIRFTSNAIRNIVYAGYAFTASVPHISEATADQNSFISYDQDKETILTAPLRVTNQSTGVTAHHVTVSNSYFATPANATDYILRTKKSGDAQDRLTVTADGTIRLGDGANPQDTNLRRFAADVLATDDAFRVFGAYLFVDNTFRHLGSAGQVGFYGATGVGKQTVTGSRSDGTALASLLSKLAALGLITDGTTA